MFADNLYMYTPGTNPMTEDSPTNPPGKKGRVRAAVASELLRAHQEERLRVAIGRSSDYYGPRGLDSGLGSRLFTAALKGKKLSWLGSLDQPHTVSYLPDIARALVTLGTDERADGKIWHLPAGQTLTGREFLGAVSDAVGMPPRLSAVPPMMLTIGGVFMPILRELKETTYQWTEPWVVDSSRFRSTFGSASETPLKQAIAETVAWFRSQANSG